MNTTMETVLHNFEKHGIHARYFETAQQAVDCLLEELHGRSIAFGGSVTTQQLGLYEKLGEDNRVFWHWVTPGEGRRQAEQACDTYICSANALAETGEIVNIDGTGNRITLATYGPQRVYYVCGVNKLTPDLHAAIHRARHIAAPRNAQRLHCNTPCAVDGKCHDCDSPDRICNVMDITMRRPGAMQVELLLIGQELGY